jgi:hypothetical protein
LRTSQLQTVGSPTSSNVTAWYLRNSGESAVVDTNAMDLWFKRLPELLESCEARDIYSADEMGLFFNCLPD